MRRGRSKPKAVFVNASGPAPTEIRIKRAEKILEITFDDGAKFRLPAEYLRVESPSAEVQGHSAEQRVTIAGRRHVGIMTVESVGNYAIQIHFDDMHDTGIFSWSYLYQLGEEQEQRSADYLAALESEGKSRDP